VKELRNLRKIKNKKRMTYKTERKENKIKNIVERSHWSIVNFLTKGYDTILMGNMSTKSVISNNKKGYELSDLDKDYLQRLSLFKLRQRLAEKSKERQVNFYIIDEYCTSITCSNCGSINRNLGGSKVYDCVECGIRIDRDVNGSRNIYIKSLM
jgi:putative transposase